MFGLERLTDGFGFLQLYRGVAAILGPPCGGFIAEAKGNFRSTFLLAGILMIVAGIWQWITLLVAAQEGVEKAKRKRRGRTSGLMTADKITLDEILARPKEQLI